MTSTPDVLLVGAGDLGTEIGLRLTANGRDVLAVRRRAELVRPPLIGMAGDVRNGLPALPDFSGTGGGPRLLVVSLTAGGRSESAYRQTFVDAVGRVLDDVRARGWQPERALFVSSTGVCAQRGDITEETPPEPSSPTSQVLLDAEELFTAGVPAGTHPVVIRPSGLYGPGRTWFIDQVRQGRVADLDRMTHRAHRDDVARAVTHLLTMAAVPEPLYLVTDDAPAPAREVARYLAEQLGVSTSFLDAAAHEASATDHRRRLHNDRLRGTGFTFIYPSYREGYAAIVAGAGKRHP